MPHQGYATSTWVELSLILDRRSWVYYLILPDASIERLRDRIEVRPDEHFYEVVNEYVAAYVQDGKMPPEAIMAPIMNISDDVLAGRDVVLRAGDYIALQDFVRG